MSDSEWCWLLDEDGLDPLVLLPFLAALRLDGGGGGRLDPLVLLPLLRFDGGGGGGLDPPVLLPRLTALRLDGGGAGRGDFPPQRARGKQHDNIVQASSAMRIIVRRVV